MAKTPLTLPFDGTAMRTRREYAGLTLTALAERCEAVGGRKIHLSYLGKLERGVCSPSPPVLKAIATALDATIDDLLTRPPATNRDATS